MLSSLLLLVSSVFAVSISYQQGLESGDDRLLSAHSTTLSGNFLYLVKEGSTDPKVIVATMDPNSGRFAYSSEIANAAVSGAFNFPQKIAFTPDRKFAVVPNQGNSNLVVLNVNSSSGALTFNSVLSTGNVIQKDALILSNTSGTFDIYVTAQASRRIAHLSMNATTGATVLVTNYTETQFPNLDSTRGIWASSDGRFLYVTSILNDSLMVFERNTSTGALILRQKVINNSGGVSNMRGPVQISGTNNHIFVRNDDSLNVSVFTRNTSTGALAFRLNSTPSLGALSYTSFAGGVIGCTSTSVVYLRYEETPSPQVVRQSINNLSGFNNCRFIEVSTTANRIFAYSPFLGNSQTLSFSGTDIQARAVNPTIGFNNLDGVTSIVVTPDSETVYAFGGNSASIHTFTKNAEGVFAANTVQTYIDDNFSIDGLNGSIDAVASRDGETLMMTAVVDQSFAVYSRNPSNNSLAMEFIAKNGAGGVTNMASPIKIITSNEARPNSAYILSSTDRSLSVWRRISNFGWQQVQTFSPSSPNLSTLQNVTNIALTEGTGTQSKVFLSDFTSNQIFVFNRNSEGELTFETRLNSTNVLNYSNDFVQNTSLLALNDPGSPFHNTIFANSSASGTISRLDYDSVTGQYRVGFRISHPDLLSASCRLAIDEAYTTLVASCQKNGGKILSFSVANNFDLTVTSSNQVTQNFHLGYQVPRQPVISADQQNVFVPGLLSDGFAVFRILGESIFGDGFED